MEIRQAEISMLRDIERIYADARAFMKAFGNADQWGDNYPPSDLIISDISDGALYVFVEDGKILAVFYYKEGADPTYEKIHGGRWLSDEPYGVIHRVAVASDSRGRGIVGRCFDFALDRCSNLRIDTHKDNIPMQKALKSRGFEYCGIIYLDNGDERIAFQKRRD